LPIYNCNSHYHITTRPEFANNHRDITTCKKGGEMEVPPELTVLLENTQSADHVVRIKAEERLSFFEKTEIRISHISV
jgi:hypothetical protein